MKRKKMKMKANKRNFAYTASRVHKKNFIKKYRRGGIRL